MAYPDSYKEKSYSWLNVFLILVCILMFGYSVYYFNNPYGHNRLMARFGLTGDFKPLPKKRIDQPLVVESPSPEENLIVAVEPEIEEPLPVAVIEPEIEPEVIEELPVEEVVHNGLPLLNDSDPLVLSTIDESSDTSLVGDNLLQQDVLHSTIVFIENFSQGELLSDFSPLFAPEAPFKVKESYGKIFMSVLGYQRYDNYTNFIVSMDAEKVVAAYKMLKPLIDQSYSEIAKPGSNFDDALNKAIDLALDVPIINGPISLNSPSVMYKFNNQNLENLSDAQKLLLRFGSKNLSKIQTKLKSIKVELQKEDDTTDELETTTDQLEATTEEIEATTDELETTTNELEAITDEIEATTDEIETATDEIETATDEIEATTEEIETATDKNSDTFLN